MRRMYIIRDNSHDNGNGDTHTPEYEEAAHNAMQGDKYTHTLHELHETMAMPPETWAKYEGQPSGAMDIVNMEVGEMQRAYTGMKTGTVTHAAFVEELLHAAAAIACAYEKMTCDK